MMLADCMGARRFFGREPRAVISRETLLGMRPQGAKARMDDAGEDGQDGSTLTGAAAAARPTASEVADGDGGGGKAVSATCADPAAVLLATIVAAPATSTAPAVTSWPAEEPAFETPTTGTEKLADTSTSAAALAGGDDDDEAGYQEAEVAEEGFLERGIDGSSADGSVDFDSDDGILAWLQWPDCEALSCVSRLHDAMVTELLEKRVQRLLGETNRKAAG